MKTTILALSPVLPASTLSNEELKDRFGGPTMDRIAKMTGITTRRVVKPHQCPSDLALTAAERLLREMARRGFSRDLVDLLIFASIYPDYRMPPTVSVLHGKLCLSERCATWDVGQCCGAYPLVLAQAHAMISTGLASYALVLNADTQSRMCHPRDRSTVVLHGDAACATLLGPCNGEGYGFEGFYLGADGKGAKYLIVPAGMARQPSTQKTRAEYTDGAGCIRTQEHIQMDGAAVFHFAVCKVPAVIREALVRFRLTLDDIDLIILHQANQNMTDLIYKALDVPLEKQYSCIRDMGNSGGPSTAVALSQAWQEGRVHPGDRTLICSFGAGLTWGVTAIRWPMDARPSMDLDPIVPDEEVLSAAL